MMRTFSSSLASFDLAKCLKSSTSSSAAFPLFCRPRGNLRLPLDLDLALVSPLRRNGNTSMERSKNDVIINMTTIRPTKATAEADKEAFWHPNKEGNASQGWFDDPDNRLLYMEWLFEKLGYTNFDDWYKLSASVLKQHKGWTLLNRYHYSTLALLQSVYPNKTFIPWLFPQVSHTFWPNRQNRIDYVNWLEARTGRSRKNLNYLDFIQNSGSGLYRFCGGTMKGVWESLESDDFQGKATPPVARNFVTPDEERSLFESIREKLGFKEGELDFWYNVSKSELSRLGIRSPIRRYPSLYHCLLNLYPTHSWEPWKFALVSSAMTRDPNVIKKSLAYAEKDLGITSPEKWYTKSITDLRRLGLRSIFQLDRQSLYDFLREHRPDFDWKESKFVGINSFGASNLGALLRELFPRHPVFSNVPISKDPFSVSLSYTIPTLRLAFDYQKDQDYGLQDSTGIHQVDLKVNEERAKFCLVQDLTLVSIPFWWDRTVKSLIATILMSRPELIKEVSVAAQDLDVTTLSPIPTSTTVELSTWRRFSRTYTIKSVPRSTPPSESRKCLLDKSKKKRGAAKQLITRRRKQVFNDSQVLTLEAALEKEYRPSKSHRDSLAKEIGVSEVRVRKWFARRRKREAWKEEVKIDRF